MAPDEQSQLKAAFAKLHRQRCEQAPPFGMMRERALRSTNAESQSGRGGIVSLRWAAFATAAVLVLASFAWQFGQWQDATPRASATAAVAPQHVEQLIDSIERNLELSDALNFPAYPTDALLTQINIESTP